MPVPTLNRLERPTVPIWNVHIAPQLTAAELHARYLGAVLRYAVARLGAGADAEDVTAEVFAAAFAALRKCPRDSACEGDDPVRAWLLGIARRKVVDILRRRERRPEHPLPPELPAVLAADPQAQVLSEEATRMVYEILAGLPELQREALCLKYLDGLSLVEIGRVLRKSPGAVGQLLHRAREAARRRGADYFDSAGAEVTR